MFKIRGTTLLLTLVLVLSVFAVACKPAVAPTGNTGGAQEQQVAPTQQNNQMDDKKDEKEMDDSKVEEDRAVEFAPAFSGKLSDGSDVTLESLTENNEKPAVVYFMASWCSTCAKNWKGIEEALPKYADDVNFVAISVDPTDSAEVLENLKSDKGLSFDIAVGNPVAAKDYSVNKQTAKFAITKDGKILSRHDGLLSEEEWDSLFASLTSDNMAKEEMMDDTKEKMDDAMIEEDKAVQFAPTFSGKLSDGSDITLESLTENNEKPAVVYFMSSSCSTCAKNWEGIEEALPKYADDVNFVAISVDPTDSANVLESLKSDKGLSFDIAVGNPIAAKDYSVKKQTAKFAISKDGEILSRHDGLMSEQEWDELFASLV